MAWQFTNDRPVYLQIMEIIQLRIVTGVYGAGEKLPTVREFADEAQVNPNTMQKALQELERDGLINSQRTSGRFVTDDDDKIRQVRKCMAKDVIADFMKKMTDLGFEKSEIQELLK